MNKYFFVILAKAGIYDVGSIGDPHFHEDDEQSKVTSEKRGRGSCRNVLRHEPLLSR